MRLVLNLGRCYFRHGLRKGIPVNSPFFTGYRRLYARSCGNAPRKTLQRALPPSSLLLATLTPGAFVQLGEEERDDGQSSEIHMLEASREELKKEIPSDARGLRRIWLSLTFAFDTYIFEPLATSFRFLHLVVIFMPVVFSTPVMLFGSRHVNRDNERGGTLWWYAFLVHSMERAGPAFIKV